MKQANRAGKSGGEGLDEFSAPVEEVGALQKVFTEGRSMKRLVWMLGVSLLLAGCRTDALSGSATGHESLTKPHEAVGGLNLSGKGGGDWHINRCELASDGAMLLSGGAMDSASDVVMNRTSHRDLARVVLRDPKSVTVNVPGEAPVSFGTAQCDALSGRMKGDVQLLTISCSAGGRDLNGAVRTLRCGG